MSLAARTQKMVSFACYNTLLIFEKFIEMLNVPSINLFGLSDYIHRPEENEGHPVMFDAERLELAQIHGFLFLGSPVLQS